MPQPSPMPPTLPPVDELLRMEFAERNLTCALGLPGAETLNVAESLAQLDEWARLIRRVTEGLFRQFRRRPQDFGHSEAYFRMLCLCSVLQQYYGVQYHPRYKKRMEWTNCRASMLPGLLGPERYGTCASLPVLIVSLGRRLGYPVHLSHTVGHFFTRWVDPETDETWNFECHGHGLVTSSDEDFRHWPEPWPAKLREEEARRGESRFFLRPLTVKEETADFLAQRGHVLEEQGRFSEAISLYEAAGRVDPESSRYRHFVRVTKLKRRLEPFWPAFVSEVLRRYHGVPLHPQKMTTPVPQSPAPWPGGPFAAQPMQLVAGPQLGSSAGHFNTPFGSQIINPWQLMQTGLAPAQGFAMQPHELNRIPNAKIRMPDGQLAVDMTQVEARCIDLLMAPWPLSLVAHAAMTRNRPVHELGYLVRWLPQRYALGLPFPLTDVWFPEHWTDAGHTIPQPNRQDGKPQLARIVRADDRRSSLMAP